MSKPFDAEVLKQSPFYQPTLDLLWASRMVKHAEQLEEAAEGHLANAIVGCFGTLAWQNDFESRDVIQHLMDVDFQKWMASPEGIAHNEMVKSKSK